jgi:hypothetical protein
MALRFIWKNRIADIPKAQWDALATPLKTPLLEWEWLRLLEDSGSVRAEVGWLPCHLTVWSGSRLVGAAPMYLKTHSAGEFVFDHVWADIARKLGIRYYPKIVGMSPFSPVAGYRFLVAGDQDERALTEMMLSAVDRLCRRNRISGCSFLFVDPDWRPLLESFGFIAWQHQSYVWQNPGFQSFDDYLSVFNANQRRNIKRERRTMDRLGIRIRALSGERIPEAYFPLMYTYYVRTNARYGPWGCKYLTKAFFEGLGPVYRHRLVLMAAFNGEQTEQPIGLSFLLVKNAHLYGRYWGSSAGIDHLHFNACYYSPIEWAIEHGIRRFDPGAGSPHKVRRGFVAIANFSMHRFYDERLTHIMQMHIDEINRLEQGHIEELNDVLPFSKSRINE